ncbi:MAG TPA: NAD-glutamate dehydrogenase [Pseudomonadales bacterium]|nr:NAD-glutamate dehydrogenase [Pseudomonadales bacterium]
MQKNASFLVAVLDHIRGRLDPREHDLAVAFTRQFWSRVASEDLENRNAEDAAGMTIACFRHFQRRAWNAVDIDVENPQYERDGWSSIHTIVQIAHPNMPFITDSVLMELSRHGLITHHLQNMVFAAVRDAKGNLLDIDAQANEARAEVMIYAEIDRLEEDRLAPLAAQLDSILKDVRAAVGDFPAMKARLHDIAAALKTAPPPLSAEEVDESIAFLEWLEQGSFTFLGYREFDFTGGTIRQVPDSALGILRNREPSSERLLAEQPDDTRVFLLERTLLAFSKSGTRSQVHRPAYPDYIAVKRFNAAGEVIGEQGFLGLYTSGVYTERPDMIPLLRKKVANIRRRSRLDPHGFDGKILAHVLASHPRDELFQSSEDELFATAMAITQIHERRRTRVFLRRDRYGLFYTCLVFMPRELYNTHLRVRIQQLLMAKLGAEDAPFDAYFSESILVRLQFVIRVPPGTNGPVDIDDLQRSIVALTRDWSQEVRQALLQECGEVTGRRFAEAYLDKLPAGYRENRSPRAAVADIQDMEQLSEERNLTMRLYRAPEDPEDMFFARVFHLGEPLPLSELIPALEHMGVRAIGELPYRINGRERTVSIHDLELCAGRPIDIAAVAERFEETFVRIWHGTADDDSLNRLVLVGGLEWREVIVLRAYARYMKQTLFGFEQEFISDTLFKHPETARLLMQLFVQRFDPEGSGDGAALHAEIVERLDHVELLNEDRILRRLLELIEATDRTNYFQRTPDGAPKDQLALKLAPQRLANVPAPVPMSEILVLSTRVEGLHLRAGPIARGGLRWSDRLEDYRTEVLGLVKAQTVKNAVIVPTGAKGGFFVRNPPPARDALMAEAIACYRQFISGLLDVTDNIVDGVVVPPPRVRRYDRDDPYLVVAADKGTATFSDYANDVSAQYGFWLGDAFASGGSNGYDHKKMGITARGAWISVQRHFNEAGIDANSDPITVLGIGDMSGDVFGNGLLRSRYLRLVAAFNHQHVFIDPNPDAASSFVERERLFALPRSGWSDYDTALISAGGGVFSRAQKSIQISPQMRERFAIDVESCSPDDLIHRLLKAPVDLIWNGGIGTYVKASRESNADVGDRTNDGVRVNAGELRARVVGEGGNLGLTQAARVEFALAGGGVNTDFIDNAGGVDCSDHEVNLKILLNQLVADGDLTQKQRNQLLTGMTESVAELVLTNNFRQAQALSIAERHSRDRLAEYQRFISRMETEQRLDRALEGVPSDEVLAERRVLTRPELAVLLSYAKTYVKERLIRSSIHADSVISETVFEEFPQVIRERYTVAARKHRLYREIVATIVANDVVHHLGISSLVHLSDFVGGEPEEIVRAYYAAARCFGIRETFRSIESLERVDGETRLDMLLQITQLARRATRWMLRHRRNALDVGELAQHFAANIALLSPSRLALMGGSGRARRDDQLQRWTRAGVPNAVAESCGNAGALVTTLPVIDAAERRGAPPQSVATIFANLNATLAIDWLVDQLSRVVPSSLWQAMERDLLLDDLMSDQAALAARICNEDCASGGESDAVDRWAARQGAFVRAWRAVIEGPQRATTQDFSLLSMTCRKLGDLIRTLPASTL